MFQMSVHWRRLRITLAGSARRVLFSSTSLLVVAVLAVTVSAIVAVLAQSRTETLLFALTAASGPCLAVGSARPRAVAAVSAYTLVLATWISTVAGGIPTLSETRLL